MDLSTEQIVGSNTIERHQLACIGQFEVLLLESALLVVVGHLGADNEVESAVVALAHAGHRVEAHARLVLMLATVGTVWTGAAHYRLAHCFQVGYAFIILLGSLHVELVNGHNVVARTGLFPVFLWFKVSLHNLVSVYVLFHQVSPRPSSS